MARKHKSRLSQIPCCNRKQFPGVFIVLQSRESHKSKQVYSTLVATSERKILKTGKLSYRLKMLSDGILSFWMLVACKSMVSKRVFIYCHKMLVLILRGKEWLFQRTGTQSKIKSSASGPATFQSLHSAEILISKWVSADRFLSVFLHRQMQLLPRSCRPQGSFLHFTSCLF